MLTIRFALLSAALAILGLLSACVTAEATPAATQPVIATTAAPEPTPAPPTPTPQPDPVAIVHSFYDAINAKDTEQALALMADDVSWRGTLYLNGKSAIRNYIQGTIDSGLEFVLRNVRATRGRVTYTWVASYQGAFRANGEDTMVIVGGIIQSAETYSYMANDARPDMAEVSFSASDKAFSGPAEIEGGWVRLTLTNEGQSLHQLQVVRLLEGKTAQALRDALLAPPHTLPAWAEPYGGPNAAEPGASASTILFLEPGDYALVDLLAAADGQSNLARGLFHGLTVTGLPRINAMEPIADVNISLTDSSIAAAEAISAGEHVVRIDNDGSQVQGVYLVRLGDGASVENFMSTPGAIVGGLASLMPGDNQYIQVTLDAGEYALICHFAAAAGQPAAPDTCRALEFSVE